MTKPKSPTKHQAITYFSQLEKLLGDTGFAAVPTAGKHLVYENTASGALVLLPPYKPTDPVRPAHLVAVDQLLQHKVLPAQKSDSAAGRQE